MSSIARFLVSNGVVSHTSDVPFVSSLLETHPGAYTTTRTHNNGSCILFWERHLQRLANSARILFQTKPDFLLGPSWSAHSSFPDRESVAWEPLIKSLVKDSMDEVEASVVKYREVGHEYAITVLVGGNKENLSKAVHLDEGNMSRLLDVHVHVGTYIPTAFGIKGSGAYLAMLGRPRVVAAGKYSDWVRLRKPLEQLSPPSVTELLLSNDGDHILEGSKTNFFVVSLRVDKKHTHADERRHSCFEVQTAPVGDGVLPGVIRQLVIEVCLSKGIAVKEAAPSWATRDTWEEAFITNSLRLVQHVERIKVPEKWESRESIDRLWQEKHFKDGPGMITALIQKEIMERATSEGYLLSSL